MLEQFLLRCCFYRQKKPDTSNFFYTVLPLPHANAQPGEFLLKN